MVATRLATVALLAKEPDPKSEKLLTAALKDVDGEVVERAAEAFGERGAKGRERVSRDVGGLAVIFPRFGGHGGGPWPPIRGAARISASLSGAIGPSIQEPRAPESIVHALSPSKRRTLKGYTRRHSAAQAIARRARIAILCVEGLGEGALADRTAVHLSES